MKKEENIIPDEYWSTLSDSEKEGMAKAMEESELFLMNEQEWKELDEESIKNIHGNKGQDIGVIAQEIETILPELVVTRDNGYKAVKYEKIVALLIEAIKEQQGEIDELRRKIK